jgi:hypothetical protein
VPQDPVSQIRAAVDQRVTTLSEIDTKLNKAADEMDMKAIVELNRQRQQVVLEVDRLKSRAVSMERRAEREHVEQSQNNFRQREREHTREVMKAYPILADRNSPERSEFDRFVMLKSEDPEFVAVFDSPRWPAIMAREFAETRGLRPAATNGTANTPAPAAPANGSMVAPPPVVPAAVRATSATVITPGSEGGSSTTPSADQLMRDLASGKLTMKQLDAMMGAPGAKMP